ncbi:hypothetical protein ACWEQ8_27595 [Streptomyces noursei]
MRDVNNQADVQENSGTIIQIGAVTGGVIHAGSGDVIGGDMTVIHQGDRPDEEARGDG